MGRNVSREESFGYLYPDLLEFWDYKINEKDPYHLLPGSHYAATFLCERGHSRVVPVRNIVKGRGKCKKCSSILYTHEYLVKEWADEKDILDFSKGSNAYVLWKCGINHVYDATIPSRILGNGCPYCSGRRVLVGFNDLATTHPHLIDEWDDENSITHYSKGSEYYAQWKCNKGHIWRNPIYDRSINNLGCPYCSGRRVLVGFNDLATTHPHLINIWNDKRSITDFSRGSNVVIDFKCSHGHEWKASIIETLKASCPYCSGRRVLVGFNDLATTHPHLIDEWDDENSITHYSKGSDYYAQWKCNKGHTWNAYVYSRTGGCNCPYCANSKILFGFNDLLTTHTELEKEWIDEKDIKDFSYGSNYQAKWQCLNNVEHQWTASISSRTKGHGCPECISSYSISQAENDISDFIESMGVQVNRSHRKIIPPYELDIYIPDKNIAIEYNGLYWHTELFGKDKHYHRNKWKECKDKGIQLLNIWEDDWNEKPQLIKNMIAHKLGISNKEKVFARQTIVKKLENSVAKEFYTANHIQGHRDGHHFGLFTKNTNELVALSTWTKKNASHSVYLDRFATSHIVSGGFSKLLKHAIKLFSDEGFEKIITFADHCVSDGALYENNGFIVDNVLKPDYSYLYRGKRNHKFGYRLKRFKNDPNLIYDKNLTERELADLNNLQRIWDCGKTRYILNI